MSKRRFSDLVSICFVVLLLTTTITQSQSEETITGTINNDTPYFEIPLVVDATSDKNLVILDMQATSGDLDTLLYVVDNYGIIVAENDDSVPGNTNSRIEFHHTPRGRYSIIATRYKVEEGKTTGDFELSVSILTEEHTALPPYSVSEEDLLAVGFPEINPRAEAEWTILAYYGADTNLEAGIIYDFNEFELAGGSNEQVRIAMLLDRIPGYSDASGDWDSTRLFEISADTSGDENDVYPPTIDTEPLAELGELNTEAGETLAQFLVWGIKNYPAEHYAIAIGGHGAGWYGIIIDQTNADASFTSMLSLSELRRAFTTVIEETGVDQFDLLINDACLMSSIEYHAMTADFFRYSLASPEIVVNPALDMTLFTQLINDDMDIVNIGEELVDTYINRDILLRESSDIVYLTHALTDLGKMDMLLEALADYSLITAMDFEEHAYMIGEIRANTYTYSSFLGQNILIDLGYFMQQVLMAEDDPDLVFAAERVLEALDNIRLHSAAGEYATERVSYYNIYFPEYSRDFDELYYRESPIEEWWIMLRSYYHAVTPKVWSVTEGEIPFHAPMPPKVHLFHTHPHVASINDPLTIEMEIIGRNLASGEFTIDRITDDGARVRWGASPILHKQTVNGLPEHVNWWHDGAHPGVFVWDVKLPVISDGVTMANVVVGESEHVYSLDGRYRDIGHHQWHDVTLIFGHDGDVHRVISRDSNSAAVGMVDIEEGSEFQVYDHIVTEDGRIVMSPGILFTWPEDGLALDFQPAPSGEYIVSLHLTAFGGATGHGEANIMVNNDDVDDEMLGFTDLDSGYTIQYPHHWTEPTFLADSQAIISHNPEKSAQIMIYDLQLLFLPDNDLDTLVTGILAEYGAELTSETSIITVGGLEALSFNYSFSTDTGEWNGQAYSVYHEAKNEAFVFAVEALDSVAEEEITEAYNILTDKTTFFNVGNERTWTYDFIPQGAFYPVHLRWLSDKSIMANGWTKYTEESDENGSTFAAVIGIPIEAGIAADSVSKTHFDDIIRSDGQDFTIIDERLYNVEDNSWYAYIYTTNRNGKETIGRLYTTVAINTAFLVWFEMPSENDSVDIFGNIFEPMLDGFTVDATFIGATEMPHLHEVFEGLKNDSFNTEHSDGNYTWP
jgi:hypothetical protein